MNIIIPIFHFVKSGGMRVLCRLASEWADTGNSVELAVADDSRPYFAVSDKVRIINFNKKGYFEKFNAIVKHIRKNDKVDCVIANHNLTAAFVWIATRSNSAVGYYYIQAYEPDFYVRLNPKSIVKRLIALYSYNLPLIKIVNSDLYKNYRQLHTDKVVYPGLDLSLFRPKPIDVIRDKVKIGTIGRVEEHKGTKDVCKAMEILRSEGIGFEFYLAFNDFDTIPHHFVIPDGDENLSTFYRDMDIIVAACKGQHGAIHYPVIETMAVGSTIVCTDYYPSTDNNAYKVDEASPEQIAEAIKRIINNKEEAIKKREQALKDVQQFDWSIVSEKFLNYLQEGSKIV